MTYTDDVRTATTEQGLDPVITVLASEGFDAVPFQSGGFCMIAAVYAADGGWVGITASEDVEGRFLVCAYLDDEDEGMVVVPDGSLSHLADYVRGFITRHGGPKVAVERYAHVLAERLLDAVLAEPERFTNVVVWEDLHDVADANDFLQEADEILGTTPVSYVDPAYVALTTEAITQVERWLAAPKYFVTVLGHVNRTAPSRPRSLMPATDSARVGTVLNATRKELDRLADLEPERRLPAVLDVLDALDLLATEARQARAAAVLDLRLATEERSGRSWREIALISGRDVKPQAIQQWAEQYRPS